MTSVVAAVYGSVTADRLDSGKPPGDALAAGFSRVALVMAILSALGIPLALLMGRHQSTKPETTIDYAVAAASNSHTMPRPDASE